MLLILILIIVVSINQDIVTESFLSSSELFLFHIMPMMFIYSILFDLLLKYNLTNIIPRKIKNFFKKIFHLNYDSSILILLSSILIGNPLTIKTIMEKYHNDEIDYHEAKHLISFNNYLSLGFILSYVSGYLFKNIYVFFIIITSNIISNLLIAAFNYNPPKETNILNKKEINLINEFYSSTYKTVDSMVNIGAIIILSGIILSLIRMLNLAFFDYIYPLLEITNGLYIFNNLNIDYSIKISLISSFISFGSLSIHAQIYPYIKCIFSYKYYLKNRIISSFLSFLIAYLFSQIVLYNKFVYKKTYLLIGMLINIIFIVLLMIIKKFTLNESS